jgi:hypothetical protein
MTAAPNDWYSAAVAITPGFEVSGDPYLGVSGDFDGMGISCGALQWNIGKGSLQPMVKAIGQAVVLSAMPTLGTQMWQACNTTIAQGLSVVRGWQTGSTLSKTARAELKALMGTPQMRAQQDVRIGKISAAAYAAATDWAAASGNTPTKRLFCWFFDLLTQNGGLKGLTSQQVKDFINLNKPDKADDVVCDYLAKVKGTKGHASDAHKNAALWRNKADGDKLPLLCASYLRSGASVPAWRHVVLNRKAAIAMGGGWVNSTLFDFSKYGL